MNVSQITSTINSFITKLNNKLTKVIPIPALLLLCSAKSRPGLSAIRSLTNICKNMEEIGITTAPNPDGTPNKFVQFAYCITKEYVRSMSEDCVIQGGLEAASIQIISQGANAAGPVASTGTNILPANLWAVPM